MPALLAIIAIAALIGVAAWNFAGASPPPKMRRLSIELPGNVKLTAGGLALSPDGETLVFAAVPATGEPIARLYMRRMDSAEVVLIPGTEDAKTPFFSPDGQSVAYFTASALMKVALKGGHPVRVAFTPPVTRGGMWLPDGSFVGSPTQSSGLYRIVDADKPQPVTTLNEKEGERAHLWPHLLPGGRSALFTVWRGTSMDATQADIAVLDLASGQYSTLIKGGAFAQYSGTGHILYVSGGALMAVPFDVESKTTRGTAQIVATNVATDFWRGGGHFAVAPDGTIVMARGAFPLGRRTPVWVDHSGKVAATLDASTRWPQGPRISTDGSRVVFAATSSDGDAEVYVLDLRRGAPVRVSNHPRDDFGPVWTPNGRLAVWSVLTPRGMPFMVTGAVDAAGEAERLFAEEYTAQFPGSVSKANVLAFSRFVARGADIWVMPLDGERKPRAFTHTAATEYGPEFSPDGEWIAYVSNESGENDVFVAPYPGPGGRQRVTLGGGVSPVWSPDGRRLYFQRKDTMLFMHVTKKGSELQFSAPNVLFSGPFAVESDMDHPRAYDVSPDGARFLMLREELPSGDVPRLDVILDWPRTAAATSGR